MSQPRTRLRVRGPDSLPVVIPHLVGFHPHNSLVILGLVGDPHTVVITIRVDLPPPGTSITETLAAWSSVLAGLVQARADEAILVVYPDAPDNPWLDAEPRPLPHENLLAAMSERLREAGIHPCDAVCAVGDRVRSYVCDNEQCCPPQGRMVAGGDVEALRLQAAFVEQGSAPLPSRDALVDQLEARVDGDPFRVEINRISDRVFTRQPVGLIERNDRFVTNLREWDGDPRNPAAFARLVATVRLLVLAIRSRDLLLRALTIERERSLLRVARTVLAEAVRCADPFEVAPLASSLAVCCWVDGDGAAAWVALDRAAAADPDYSLAGLVAAALEQGLPPWTWSQMMAGLSEAEILGPDPAELTAALSEAEPLTAERPDPEGRPE